MRYTLKSAAQSAIDVQNASNLSGVLSSLNTIVQETLWPLARTDGQGTSWINQHPIVTLYLSKLASLNRTDCLCSDCFNSFGSALTICEQLAAADAEVSVTQ
jgi:hypothetical protein